MLIDKLPDDVLLAISDFYVGDGVQVVKKAVEHGKLWCMCVEDGRGIWGHTSPESATCLPEQTPARHTGGLTTAASAHSWQ